MATFEHYQEFYTKRLQSLERLKESTVGQRSEESESQDWMAFDRLKDDMICLMENDVTLMRQLLALGEKIEQLKVERLSPAVSISSLATDDDFDTDCEVVSGTVNHLLVSDSPHPPRKQYFSRQNSVLRIPIPPCHRHHHHRLRTIASSCASDEDSSSGVGSERSKSAEDEDKLSPLVSPNGSFCQKAESRHRAHGSQDSGIHLPSSVEEKEEVFV